MFGMLTKWVIAALIFSSGPGAAGKGQFKVASSSMYPTLAKGAAVTCDQTANAEYVAGDVVVYKHPKRPGQYGVKTLVAGAGDIVLVHSGSLFINYRKIHQSVSGGRKYERFANGRAVPVIYSNPGALANFFPAAKVPEGHVFVLGNNRDRSVDSRDIDAHGPVPAQNIVCKVRLGDKA